MMRIIYRWSLVIIWIIIIYVMSATPVEYSWDLSGKIADKAVISTPQENNDTHTKDDSRKIRALKDHINVIVRKCAHIIEYFILCGLLIFAFLASVSNIKSVFNWSFILALGYACLDEIHQLYVPGRTGDMKDVLIDSIGITLAVVGCILWRQLRRKQ